ncbi:hypothetical protein ABTE27_23405, partial [Acinetobacter baumannii]
LPQSSTVLLPRHGLAGSGDPTATHSPGGPSVHQSGGGRYRVWHAPPGRIGLVQTDFLCLCGAASVDADARAVGWKHYQRQF